MNDGRRLGFTAWEFGTNRPSGERQALRWVEWRCGPVSGAAGIRDEVSLAAVPPVVRSSPFAANSAFGAFTGRRSGRTDATD